MTLVVDASVVVASLVDSGEDGEWAAKTMSNRPLVAPALMPVEVARVLRRAVLAGEIPDAVASQAHAELLELRVDLFPYEPFGPRAWQLRSNIRTYDAWYIALAESLGAPLATLDRRLTRATGPACRFETP
jgi:predicted nucleic acid-binding protein